MAERVIVAFEGMNVRLDAIRTIADGDRLGDEWDHLRTVIIAPMTSKGFEAPFRVPVTHAGTKGLILLDQIRAVDKVRLIRRLGAVSGSRLNAILATLQEVFAQ